MKVTNSLNVPFAFAQRVKHKRRRLLLHESRTRDVYTWHNNKNPYNVKSLPTVVFSVLSSHSRARFILLFAESFESPF